MMLKESVMENARKNYGFGIWKQNAVHVEAN